MFSPVGLFAAPLTVVQRSPLSMVLSRQEYWSRLPFPSPGDLPDPGIEPVSPALQEDSWLFEPPYNNLWNAVETMLREKFTALNTQKVKEVLNQWPNFLLLYPRKIRAKYTQSNWKEVNNENKNNTCWIEARKQWRNLIKLKASYFLEQLYRSITDIQ